MLHERLNLRACTGLHIRYINQALAFSIQRAGFLYGEEDAEGNVKAHFIYEPPQQVRTGATRTALTPPTSPASDARLITAGRRGWR